MTLSVTDRHLVVTIGVQVTLEPAQIAQIGSDSTMVEDVVRCADLIECEHGPDIEEALRRWQAAGGHEERAARPWLSVAFLFSRRRRTVSAA